MRFQDESPVVTEFDDFVKEEEEENEVCQDMWSLMRPEPRSDSFASLLAGDGGKEFKVNAVAAAPWDSTALKSYVPIARSRSSLSNDSLQLCTEGLGCESGDCLSDSASESSSSVISDDYLSQDEEIDSSFDENEDEDEEEEEFEREETNLSARSFPPPLPTLCASSAAYMRSFKKDGRFVLQSVKVPLQNFLHSHREGGRLQMHLVSTMDDDDLALPMECMEPQNEIFAEEMEEEFGEDQPPQVCPNHVLSSDIPAVHQSEPLPVDSPKNHYGSSIKCNNKSPAVEFKVTCNMPPEKCKAIDNESANAKREIPEGKSFPKTSAPCRNIYSGWRTERAEQNSAAFCYNWQKAQDLPNYPLNKLKYAEAVNMISVHDHVRMSKFRVNDLGLGRCHDANSLSVWGKSPCIATSS